MLKISAYGLKREVCNSMTFRLAQTTTSYLSNEYIQRKQKSYGNALNEWYGFEPARSADKEDVR